MEMIRIPRNTPINNPIINAIHTGLMVFSFITIVLIKNP